jgi:hypothetical protein
MQALIDEYSKSEYASMSDQAAADAINLLMITIPVNVPIGAIIKYAVDNGIYGKVNADAYDPSLPKEQRVAIWNIKGWVDHHRYGTQSAHSVRVVRDVMNGETAKKAGWTQQNVNRYNTTQTLIDAHKHGDPDLVI